MNFTKKDSSSSGGGGGSSSTNPNGNGMPPTKEALRRAAASANSADSEALTIDQLVHQDDWVCDSERYRCHVCTRNFNGFRRKHHCRKCGEVVCRNCTLYKEAELPVIGRSRVRVCMSCILSHVNNPQPPPVATAVPINNKPNNTLKQQPPPIPSALPPNHNKTETTSSSTNWNHLQSPTHHNEDGNEVDEEALQLQAYSQFDYQLDYKWEHVWPKPPVLPDEKQRLKILKSFEILDTPPEDVFGIICDLASNALKCPIAAVSLIDEDRQWFKANVGLAQNEIPRNVAFCAHTIYSKEPLVVMNALNDERFQKNPLVTGAAGIRFYAGAPICTSTGHVLGTVFVFDTRVRDSCDVATLEKLSNVAMKNLEDRKSATATSTTTASTSSSSATGTTTTTKKKSPAPPAPVANDAAAENKKTLATNENITALQISSNETHQEIVAQQSAANGGGDGQIVGGQKMETMLMDLLCRTTETQQQLATQQGAMFQTLGQHSSQIENLAETMARLEAKLENQN